MSDIQSVLTSAPLRISFLGGGSDIATFYMEHKGAVVSAAINKYVYVHVKRHDSLFQEKYRISYSEVEHVQDRRDIRNDIVRTCLEFLSIEEALQISTSSDLPAFSGLGSSSSFTVALLLALHSLKGQQVSRAQLAEEACFVEIQLLQSPIGKQDQYAAAFGGLNFLEFFNSNSVRIEPILLTSEKSDFLFEHLRLMWTGKMRKAHHVLDDQANRSEQNLSSLQSLVDLAHQFRDSLQKDGLDLRELGSLILSGWELKKNLSARIVTPEVNLIERLLREEISFGHKLLGAGAGGFMLAVLKDPSLARDFETLKMFQPKLDVWGARVLSSN